VPETEADAPWRGGESGRRRWRPGAGRWRPGSDGSTCAARKVIAAG